MDFIRYWPEYHRYIGSVYEALREKRKRKQEEDRQRGKVLWFLANFLQAYLLQNSVGISSSQYLRQSIQMQAEMAAQTASPERLGQSLKSHSPDH